MIKEFYTNIFIHFNMLVEFPCLMLYSYHAVHVYSNLPNGHFDEVMVFSSLTEMVVSGGSGLDDDHLSQVTRSCPCSSLTYWLLLFWFLVLLVSTVLCE